MSAPFQTHRAAALALLNSASLNRKEGGFLGQLAVQDELSDKQRKWLVILLDRHGLPPGPRQWADRRARGQPPRRGALVTS